MTTEIAIGLIRDNETRLLITKRGKTSSHPGIWEFPGGKLEPNESPLEALKREIMEEVGLQIIEAKWLTEFSHSYDQKKISLTVFLVSKFSGIASCCELQTEMQWVSISELKNYEFPEANQTILPNINHWCS